MGREKAQAEEPRGRKYRCVNQPKFVTEPSISTFLRVQTSASVEFPVAGFEEHDVV
jgi:hypothetical protein